MPVRQLSSRLSSVTRWSCALAVPARPGEAPLTAAGLPVVDIEALYQTSLVISGEPKPIEFTSRIVGVVRYRDGSVIDVVRQVKE